MKTLIFSYILIFLGLSFQQRVQAQCPVANPVTVDSCSFSAGQVTLLVSGSLGYYNWYDAPVGGNLIGVGGTFTTDILSSTTSFFASATDTNTALTFDGVNDYLAINKSYVGIGAIPTLTVEAKVKTSVSGVGGFDNWAIVDFDRSEFFNFYVDGSNGNVCFATARNVGGVDDFCSTNFSVNDGEWHHVTAQYDGTDKILFIDGVEVARKTNPHGGNPLGTNITRFGYIGDGSESATYNAGRNNLYYQGEIDEVRLWSTVRTPAQILAFKDTCLTGSETGLALYYDFNEFSGTTVTDLSGNGATGTLFNMNATTSWVSGAPVSCLCESARQEAVATISSNLESYRLSCVDDSTTFDAGPGYATYNWSTGATSQLIGVKESGSYSVTVSGGACAGSASASVYGRQGSSKSLVFDGSNDYAAIQSLSYASSNNTELTIEAWMQLTSTGDNIIASFDRSEYWRFEVNGDIAGPGQIGLKILTSAGQLDFFAPTLVNDGAWHHVAAVFDNGTINLFIDGMLDATTTSGVTFGTGLTRYGFLGTGSEASVYNGTRGPNNHFNGQMDEVRIWTVARTQAQIRSTMSTHLAGSESGLAAYYKFDEDNGLVLRDFSAAPTNNAQLVNFAAAPRVNSGAPIGDESVSLYTATWAGQSLSITSCNGEEFTIDSMTGSPDGVHLYVVNAMPENLTGLTSNGSNDKYFGVFKVNDATASYRAVYDYSLNTLADSNQADAIRLWTRSNNASASWSLGAFNLDTLNKTITATAQSTEFALGATDGPLPVELLYFRAQKKESYVMLSWATLTEINNDFFSIERSQNAAAWEEIGRVVGAGNANFEIEYSFQDINPLKGVSYYRLKQIDFDGQFSYSNVERVTADERSFNVYPNPTSRKVVINGLEPCEDCISFSNLLGQSIDVRELRISWSGTKANLDLSSLENGVYLLFVNGETLRIVKQ